MTQAKLVVIGEVIKPHGVRGEFSVACHADSPLLFAPGCRLGLRTGGKGGRSGKPAAASPIRWVKVLTSRPHQGRLLITIEGVGDRDAAETLRGLEVVVEDSALPELPEGEVYLHEMVGFDAVLPGGEHVGVLEGFLDVPGQDLWVIRSPEGKEILFPAHDETVVEIDAEARRVVIDPPPGLLDIF